MFLKMQMDSCKSISVSSVAEVTELNKMSLLICPIKPILILDLDETLIGSIGDEIICRPFAIDMISTLNKVYEIWIWTASERPYAQFIIDWMGISSQIRLLLCREDCVSVGGHYVKDIHRFVNIDEKRVVMVDNLVASFISELTNGIVVGSFYGNSDDTELSDLTCVLQNLAQEDDVRIKIKEFFNYSDYIQNGIL
jgi:TFIIF-interacting CTD phosphatase-like protein